MDAVIFAAIPLSLVPAEVFKRIRMGEADDDAPQVRRLIAAAESFGRPKALFREAYVERRTDDTVVLDGVTFQSRVLRVNMEQAQRAFGFLATCGVELEAWAKSLDDMLERYWADAIMELALMHARRYLNEQLGQVLPQEHSSVMNPGSLADWPITQQRPLFALIGEAAGAIGVTLTDSLLMTPAKSVSGIRFATEARFESCELCPRIECPGRRAPYDKTLFDRRYARRGSQP